MTEAPRLTLVQAALEEVGAPTEAAKLKATKELLARYAPSIAKRARQDREAEILAEAGVKAVSDLTLLPAIKAAHEAELARVGKHHDKGAFWRGVSIGGVVAASIVTIAAAWYTQQVINPAFDAAARMQMQQSVVDSFQRSPTADRPRSQSAPETYERGRREPADR